MTPKEKEILREIAQVASDINARLEVALVMVENQPIIAKTNIEIARTVCQRVKKELRILCED